MVEASKDALRVGFDGSLEPAFNGSKITSDAGLVPYRELDDVLGLTTMVESLLQEWRTGQNTRHLMVAVLRQSVFSRLARYEDTNDADRSSIDAAIRHVVGGRRSRGRFARIGSGRVDAGHSGPDRGPRTTGWLLLRPEMVLAIFATSDTITTNADDSRRREAIQEILV